MKLKQKSGRPAFTLVEMLVATALIMFIMLILSEAFVAGLEAFRTLKGIGDMEERLRSVVTPLRADLAADHFEGRRRLSDPNFWNMGSPREGFVNVTQGFSPTLSPNPIPAGSNTITLFLSATPTWTIQPSLFGNPNTNTGTVLLVDPGLNEERMLVVGPWPPPPGNNTWMVQNLNGPPGTPFVNNHTPNSIVRVIRQLEGLDADQLPVARATDHVLHLAVKLRGNRPEDFFTAHLPYYPFNLRSPPYAAPSRVITNPFFPLSPGFPRLANPNYLPTTFFDQALDGRFQDFAPTSPLAGYKTQWAEIAYFLWPNGTTAGKTPLYALYRAEFKVVPDNRYLNGDVYNGSVVNPPGPNPPPFLGTAGTAWNPPPLGDGFNELSVLLQDRVYHFINPSSLTTYNVRTFQPDRTFTYFYDDPFSGSGRGVFDPNNPDVWSATLIATDVVSFDVQILSPQSGVADFTDVLTGVFDTGPSPPWVAPPPNWTINAVKITLRVWDLKTRQTRQVTVIQDM
jgi:hypothetical protein